MTKFSPYFVSDGAQVEVEKIADAMMVKDMTLKKLRKMIKQHPEAINVASRSHNGQTLLTYYTWKGELDLVKELIISGARLEMHEYSHPHRPTALDVAAKYGFYEVVKLLLAAGANIQKGLEGTLAYAKTAERPIMEIEGKKISYEETIKLIEAAIAGDRPSLADVGLPSDYRKPEADEVKKKNLAAKISDIIKEVVEGGFSHKKSARKL